MEPRDALDEVVELVRARYEPAGNFHAVGRYVSASHIVRSKAHSVAHSILRAFDPDVPPSNVPKYWSYLGNTLADETFADFHTKEIRTKVCILPCNMSGCPGEDCEACWFIQGHADGVTVVDGKVIVGEHKAHMNKITAGKVEIAFRQGSLYLAMMWNKRKWSSEGSVSYPVADWAVDDPRAAPFHWTHAWQPGGVVVAIARNTPPPIIVARRLNSNDLDEILSFYSAKARAIIDAVNAKDAKLARETWDTGPGKHEFGPHLNAPIWVNHDNTFEVQPA